MELKPIVELPTDEQVQLLDILRNNNLLRSLNY